MEINRMEKKQKLNILTILAFVIVARLSCPALSNIPLFSMAFVFIYGVSFIFLYFFSKKAIKRQDMGLLMISLVYTLYIFLRNFIANQGLFARDCFNAYVIVFLTIIFIWVKEQPESTKVVVLKLIFMAFTFNYAYSIYVLWYDPNASRIAAATSVLEKSPYDVLVAVGGFDAVYGGLSVVMILLYTRRVFKEKKVNNKLTLWVLILAIVFLVMASYMTAIVLLIVSLALYWGSKNPMLSIVLIILICLVIIFHQPIGDTIIDLSKSVNYSETVKEKTYEVGYMLKTFESAGTYSGEEGRLARMSWSINSFKHYPIFGGMGHPGAKVGGHSEILDMLGYYGLTGFALAVAYFICLYKNIKLTLQNQEMKKCFNIIMLVFGIAAALNPSLYSLQMIPIILMISLAPSYTEMCIDKLKSGEMKK